MLSLSPSWVFGAIALAFLVGWQLRKAKTINVPLVRGDATALIDLLHEGYTRYTRNDAIFKLQTPQGEHLVLPFRFVHELKNLPASQISFAQWLKDVIRSTPQHDGRIR